MYDPLIIQGGNKKYQFGFVKFSRLSMQLCKHDIFHIPYTNCWGGGTSTLSKGQPNWQSGQKKVDKVDKKSGHFFVLCQYFPNYTS